MVEIAPIVTSTSLSRFASPRLRHYTVYDRGTCLLVIKGFSQERYGNPKKFSVGGLNWYASCRLSERDGLWVRVRCRDSDTDASIMAIVNSGVLDHRQSPPALQMPTRRMMVARQTCHFRLATKQELRVCGLMRNGSMKISCCIHVIRPTTGHIAVLPTEVHSDLGRLLESGRDADVTFCVGGEMFAAHNCMLAVRSPVLAKELKQSTNDGITVEDMEPAVFGAVLRFIYTDTLPETEEIVEDWSKEATMAMNQRLFVAADRYQLDRMKAICLVRLCRDVNVHTAAMILAFAEQQRCQQLQTFCCRFIVANGRLGDFMNTDGYKRLVEGRLRPAIDELLMEAGRALKKSRTVY